MLISLIIKEMRIQSQWDASSSPENKCWGGSEETGTLVPHQECERRRSTENSIVVLQTTMAQQFRLRYIPPINESRGRNSYLYTRDDSSIFYNNHKVEAIQMFINR